MDPVSISALVMACLSLAASVITPLVVASAEFIKRIKKSSCCGGSGIELADPTNMPPLQTQPLVNK